MPQSVRLKHRNDWDRFLSLLESQHDRGSDKKLTTANFLVVVITDKGGSEMISIKAACLSLLDDAAEVVIVDDGKYLDVGDIVTELNCSSQIQYILLSYRKQKGKNYAKALLRALQQNNRLLVKKVLWILDLPR